MKTMTLTQRMLLVVTACCLAFLLTFGLSAGVSAADDYTVEIYLQTADRTQSPVDVDVLTANPIEVLVDTGDTLQDAIEEAVPSADWSGEYLEALTYNSITYTNATTSYTDTSVYPEDPWTHGIWVGDSWMWFNGQPSAMPASQYSYPGTTLGETEVTDDTTITLSFETSSYTW